MDSRGSSVLCLLRTSIDVRKKDNTGYNGGSQRFFLEEVLLKPNQQLLKWLDLLFRSYGPFGVLAAAFLKNVKYCLGKLLWQRCLGFKTMLERTLWIGEAIVAAKEADMLHHL